VSKLGIKKNDIVAAMRGRSAGKTGKVLEVLPERGRALVEGLNLVKKTLRKTQDTPKGGIVDKESSIATSNLMLYCPTCKKGVRIRRAVEGDKNVRKCKGCGHLFI
jgi:large subunit ribosomal protein L24